MASSPISPRTAAIAGGVVLLHAAALWALNEGLLRQASEVVVPVQMLSELITPPEPQVQPPPAPLPKPQPPVQQPVARRKPTQRAPAPRPVAPPQPPSPNAPVAVSEPQSPAPLAPPAPAVAAAPAPAGDASPVPAKVELPSTNAEYLQNPAPNYPPASRRAGEQGKVIVRVLIGADGTAKDAELRQSSGFDRLDRAALETVRKWRYVPGKRNGVPETMWFNVPINFVLE